MSMTLAAKDEEINAIMNEAEEHNYVQNQNLSK